MKKHIINTEKNVKTINITAHSDLHFDKDTSVKRLKFLLNLIESENPDYNLFLGDFIDDAKIGSDYLRCLRKYLEELGKFAPIYYVLGNHDGMTRNKNNNWEGYTNDYFMDLLYSLDNMHIVENDVAKLQEGISITGISLPWNFYEKDEESREKYIEYANNLYKYIKYKLNSSDFNIFLQHTPNNAFEKEVIENLDLFKNIDLIISGHQHNGLVPKILNKFGGNRGLVGFYGPNLTVGLDNCRGEKQITDNTKGIILPPTRAFNAGNFQPIVDKILPNPVENIKIMKKVK